METLVLSLSVALLLAGGVLAVRGMYWKVAQGTALIISKTRRGPAVFFEGRIVLPIIQQAEIMDISLKKIVIERKGRTGLICKDNIRADVQAVFLIGVHHSKEDILQVARSIGCARAADQTALEELFCAKFSEALKTVANQYDFEELYTSREAFRDNVIDMVGRDLNGFILDDVSIDDLEQTPIEQLDKNNMLDVQGLHKIMQVAAEMEKRCMIIERRREEAAQAHRQEMEKLRRQ